MYVPECLYEGVLVVQGGHQPTPGTWKPFWRTERACRPLYGQFRMQPKMLWQSWHQISCTACQLLEKTFLQGTKDNFACNRKCKLIASGTLLKWQKCTQSFLLLDELDDNMQTLLDGELKNSIKILCIVGGPTMHVSITLTGNNPWR